MDGTRSNYIDIAAMLLLHGPWPEIASRRVDPDQRESHEDEEQLVTKREVPR